MKKMLLLLFLPFVLFASNMQYELKIYATLLSNLFPNHHTIKVWSDDAKKSNMLSYLSSIKIVKDINNADILIVQRKKDLPKNKIIFATNYLILKHYKREAIGGFYWKKGRPNILFLRSNLFNHHIKLPSSFNDFIEDRL